MVVYASACSCGVVTAVRGYGLWLPPLEENRSPQLQPYTKPKLTLDDDDDDDDVHNPFVTWLTCNVACDHPLDTGGLQDDSSFSVSLHQQSTQPGVA